MCAAHEGPDGCRIQVESRGEFSVTQAFAAQDEQFRLTGFETGQHQPDLALFFRRGVHLFGRGRIAAPAEHSLVPVAAREAAQFVESHPDGGAIEPRAGVIALRAGLTPQFPEDFDGQFFGARGIFHDASNHPRDAFVVRVEEGLEIEDGLARRYSVQCFGFRVHTLYNDAQLRFVTAGRKLVHMSETQPGTLENPASTGHYVRLDPQQGWRTVLNWVSAILISLVFLVAGLWKVTDPAGAAVRLAQARVPEQLSLAAALGFGIAETFGGVLLLVPRFRRWGSIITSLLLVAFMIFIGIHYNELRGAECSCFPWLKRAVGPGFFLSDGIMLLLAIAAGWWARNSDGLRPALVILGAVTVFAVVSYGVNLTRHTGTKAPETVKAEDGSVISLNKGKVFVYFFNPQCLHCLDAGRKLAALNWGDTRFVGVPTENPRFAGWFMGKAGLTGRGPVSPDLDVLKKVFPFDLPPAGVALQDGYEKGMLLQFEDQEPGATLKKLGFVY